MTWESPVRGVDLPVTEPVGIQIVDENGVVTLPRRVVYLGPDVDSDTHYFEAWFRLSDIDVAADPKGRITRMPGKTSLRFRFEL